MAEPLDEVERRPEEAQGAKAVLRDSRAEKPQQDGKAKPQLDDKAQARDDRAARRRRSNR